MSRKHWAVCASLLALGAAGVALADGLIGGTPLQYGHAYTCAGERVIVGRCRTDTDDAYCQVLYPDRPPRGGFAYETVEQRGDVINKLRNCPSGQKPQAGTKAGQTPAPRAVAPSAATAAAPAKPTAPATPEQAAKVAAAAGISPRICPQLKQMIAATRDNFKAIDLGPNLESTAPEIFHKTSFKLPGASCDITYDKGNRDNLSCSWPPMRTDDELDSQFVGLINVVEACTGAHADMSRLEEERDPTAIVIVAGAAFSITEVNDFLAIDVKRAGAAKPAAAKSGASPAARKRR